MVSAQINGKLAARAGNSCQFGSPFHVRSFLEPLISGSFDIRATTGAIILAGSDIRAITSILMAVANNILSYRSGFFGSRHNAFVKPGFMIYARDVDSDVVTQLGFINEGDTELTGVSLSTGTYDIEARPWGWFWPDCRSSKFLRVIISGGGILNAIPEAIVNLRANPYSDWGRDILWTWHDSFRPADPTHFGLWFSVTSPVSTAGAPDVEITTIKPAGDLHMYRYAQTEAIYIAMRAKDNILWNGPVSEIFLDFPSGSINSPDPQWATEGL